MTSASTHGGSDALVRPGVGGGLADVFRQRFLLKLLVRKELQIRYRGSVLGLLWSYVKPGVQFVVFYIALGVFLGLQNSPGNPDGLENYAIYLFSGIVLINFFTEALSNASRSIVGNGGLIKKIYLPRELFPVASVWVSGVHFVPQLAVLLVACFVEARDPAGVEVARRPVVPGGHLHRVVQDLAATSIALAGAAVEASDRREHRMLIAGACVRGALALAETAARS